jgi:hypothetical protein
MIDSTILAGLLGVGGSIAGTILGYKLNNSKADVNVYIDNRVVVYYLKKEFCMYLPLTITNEGSKSSTISDFRVTLVSPTNQEWTLYWLCFAEDNTFKGESWSDDKRASPILIHGNSGNQYHVKLIETTATSQGLSSVLLPAGEYKIKLEYFDRNRKPVSNQEYKFKIDTEFQQILAERREDFDNLGTVIFNLTQGAEKA